MRYSAASRERADRFGLEGPSLSWTPPPSPLRVRRGRGSCVHAGVAAPVRSSSAGEATACRTEHLSLLLPRNARVALRHPAKTRPSLALWTPARSVATRSRLSRSVPPAAGVQRRCWAGAGSALPAIGEPEPLHGRQIPTTGPTTLPTPDAANPVTPLPPPAKRCACPSAPEPGRQTCPRSPGRGLLRTR